MTNRCLFACIICCLAFSCKQEEPEFFSVSKESVEFAWKQGKEELKLNANRNWFVSNKLPAWLTVSSEKTSEKDVLNLIIQADQNNSYEPRTAEIILKAENLSIQIIVSQSAKGKLKFKEQSEKTIKASGTNLVIEIDMNISYEMKVLDGGDDWIYDYSAERKIGTGLFLNAKNNGLNKENLHIIITPNYSKKERRARIVIYNDYYELSDSISILQEAGIGFHPDGEVIKLKESNIGDANLVVMGDGFTINDLEPNGFYDVCIINAASYFFSIEPFTTYSDYFNVYAVYAASENSGIGSSTKKINNKFSSTYGSGTGITCNDNLVMEYARRIPDVAEDKPLIIIVVLNDNKYAGTTYLMKDGNSIALCPMSEEESPNDFEGIIHHEAGGHGFGFLCDEYVYNQQKIPESEIQSIKEWQELGFQMNLDFTNDLDEILWKGFIGLPGYETVGAYEGGAQYQYGVWRSEENSCMNNNIPYFNVISRWTIVKRIMEMAGKGLTLQDFIEKDKPIINPNITTRSYKKKLPPLGEPIWKK